MEALYNKKISKARSESDNRSIFNNAILFFQSLSLSVLLPDYNNNNSNNSHKAHVHSQKSAQGTKHANKHKK